MALGAVSQPGAFQYLGVTRTLNVTYLKGVRAGMKVVVGNEVLSVGGRLSVIRGWIAESDGTADGGVDGGLLAVCEHGKVNTDPPIGRKRDGSKL
jgi:acyl-coenzyme A thioesterase 13